MQQTPPIDIEFITDSASLLGLVKKLADEPRIGVDTESNGFHRYPERVCLIQLASASHCYLIDLSKLQDLQPLGELFASHKTEKIFHSADYDLRVLDRDFSIRVNNLYDTSVAAHFTGMDKLGLGTVLEQALGIRLVKPKHLQRANWGLRPLSKAAIDYAATDVIHLLALREELGARLESLGRSQWVKEELIRLENLRYPKPSSLEHGFLKVKGSGKLSPQQLAILKQLYLTREKEGLRRGRPPSRILSSQVLLTLAGGDGVESRQTSNILKGPFGNRLMKAIQKGRSAPPEYRPKGTKLFSSKGGKKEQERLKALKDWRATRASELTMDPALVWPMTNLERLAREPNTILRESEFPELRKWQIEKFGKSLQKTQTQLTSKFDSQESAAPPRDDAIDFV